MRERSPLAEKRAQMKEVKRRRVVLADDQALYREGLCELIKRWSEFEIVGVAANGEEAVEVCLSTAPDLVLLDIQMPKMGGIDAAHLIGEALPDTFVVMLTVESSKDIILSALDAGVKGFMLKDTPAGQLRSRLNSIFEGEGMIVSDSVTEKVVEELGRLRDLERNSIAQRVDEGNCFDWEGVLTNRDIEILRLIAEGKSNEEISKELFLSLSTVKKQIASVMQRLSLDNRVQLAVFAVQQKLTV